MVEKATGLVLRTRRLTETSLIVHWLTPTLGRIATVAKGALRPKSPFRGKLDLFFLADFSFSRSRRSELHTLREVTVREPHAGLRRDLACLQQAAYCAALIETATETETPLPEIFELLRGFLDNLTSAQPALVFTFELKLLDELGMRPDLEGSGAGAVPVDRTPSGSRPARPGRSGLTPGAVQLVRAMTSLEWGAINNLRLGAAQQAEISRFLAGFLAFHLGRIPAGREQL